MTALLRGRVVVLSPHPDDAVFSLGGTIARAARSGADVRVLVPFANDPASPGQPSKWDQACGFRSAGEAARVRREEDARACKIIGAVPAWLPFPDAQHGSVAEDELATALTESVAGSDVLLLPGYPLAHPDHARATRASLTVRPQDAALGFYVEQPYAAWLDGTFARRRGELPAELAALLPGRLDWEARRRSPLEWGMKQRALLAYASQLRGFGRRVIGAVAFDELRRGGETLGFVAD